MGNLSVPLPQGPMKHCGKLEAHDKHPNLSTVGGGVAMWCDGVTPLEPFVELTIRVPLSNGGAAVSNAAAVKLLATHGMSFFVNYLDHPKTALVLRARTQDGVDRVYPVIRNAEGKGFKAVEMPDGY